MILLWEIRLLRRGFAKTFDLVSGNLVGQVLFCAYRIALVDLEL